MWNLQFSLTRYPSSVASIFSFLPLSFPAWGAVYRILFRLYRSSFVPTRLRKGFLRLIFLLRSILDDTIV